MGCRHVKHMDKRTFIKQLKKLVAFETITGNVEANSRALDYVQTLLDKRVVVKRIKNKNTEILIAGNFKTSSPDVAYMVHMDVVSAKKSQFTVVQRGDKLFGRGASDMKFSIPMGVSLLNDLIAQKSKLSFALVITTDEEVGGFDGGSLLGRKS